MGLTGGQEPQAHVRTVQSGPGSVTVPRSKFSTGSRMDLANRRPAWKHLGTNQKELTVVDSYSRLAAALWFLPIDRVAILASLSEELILQDFEANLDSNPLL